jgi:hypothetical protein
MCAAERGAEGLDQNGSGLLHLLSRPVQHCLAPYSPDLNPIEQAFPKLKVGLRKAGAPKHPRRSGPPLAGSSTHSAWPSAEVTSPTQVQVRVGENTLDDEVAIIGELSTKYSAVVIVAVELTVQRARCVVDT